MAAVRIGSAVAVVRIDSAVVTVVRTGSAAVVGIATTTS